VGRSHRRAYLLLCSPPTRWTTTRTAGSRFWSTIPSWAPGIASHSKTWSSAGPETCSVRSSRDSSGVGFDLYLRMLNEAADRVLHGQGSLKPKTPAVGRLD